MTAYTMQLQTLKGIRIDELLAIQPDNFNFDNKTLQTDVTYTEAKKDSAVNFKDTT